ncbi:alpha/beta fold hydrolase [Haloarchaeobius sp. TZWWS8]|uniref:alpha/beta fold hydrolase n=1 Tax=Haloarchaeobius sp. TZWWS8 TaxID=3446121 RepID=UPI003EBCA9FF
MQTVPTNGILTHYERRGSGPAVVFVHASILDHSMWDEQVEALADDYTTVVYDVRGHGRTGGSDLDTYSIGLYADDLHELVTALELDRPVICGLSMGAMVAMTYAVRYPDDLSGLVLADAFTPEIVSKSDWLVRRIVLNALIPPVRLFGYQRVERANVWLTERFARGAGGNYERIEQLRADGPPMATDEFVKVVRSMTRFHDEPVDLSAIAVPTLVIYGENELPSVKQHAAELAARVPDVTVDVVPDAGHASNLDQPAYFSNAVRNLVERAYGTGGLVRDVSSP